MVNVKGLVFACYLSARHRPSQVSATPQPICVITTTFSHFPDNVLHPHTPIRPPLLSTPCRLHAFLAFLNPPHFLLSSILSPSFILLLALLYFCNPLSPIHYLNLLFLFFLSTVSHPFLFSLLSPFPHAFAMLPLSPYSIPPILQRFPHIRKCWILTSACRSSDP